MYKAVVDFIKNQFPAKDFVPLHEPIFIGNEKKYLNECIDSTYVSSVGKYVDQFELHMAELAQTKYAIATTNGTSALHMALMLAGTETGDLVITQPLSFVATCNAISYIGAHPLFVDVDNDTLGLSPHKLREFLNENCELRQDGKAYYKKNHQRIAACVPMHTFGLPCRIDEIVEVCAAFNIAVIEDAAESIGSSYKGQHTGSFGLMGTFSFNGNKTITCGGGGAIVTNDETIAKRAKHLTTQAKVPHRWEFVHDEVGYNYRMPNINAALACAQLENLSAFIDSKRELAAQYKTFFSNTDIQFVSEPNNAHSNFWLCGVLLSDVHARNEFLQYTNDHGVMTRPVWQLMNKLPMFSNAVCGNLENAEWIEQRLVNIPSSARMSK